MRARQGDEGKVAAAGTNVAADLAVTPRHDTARRRLYAGIKREGKGKRCKGFAHIKRPPEAFQSGGAITKDTEHC